MSKESDMPIGDITFKVGDRVVTVATYPFLVIKESRVAKILKNGNFTLEGSPRQWRQDGSQTGGSGKYDDAIYHWTVEMAAQASHNQLAHRTFEKLNSRFNRNALLDLSTDQLCRIEALLDKIAEERAKEGV